MSISITIDYNINKLVQYIVYLDFKQEAKETLNDLINKTENIMYDGMIS
jgi:hypothetical protein